MKGVIEEQIQRDVDPDDMEYVLQKPFIDYFIISKTNRFYTNWVLVVAVASAISAIQGLFMAGNQVNITFEEIENGEFDKVFIIVEIIFFIDLITQFFIEYNAEGGKTLYENDKPVRDFLKIAKRYITNEFLFDLLPCIPWSFFIDPKRTGIDTLGSYDYYYLIFLIKFIRLDKAATLFNP